ncbi:MAG: MarR family winged helix-turn-helix transcriptional regulator [Actinomycetota bacterium]
MKQNYLSKQADDFARQFLLWSFRVRKETNEAPPENALVAAVRADESLAPRHLVAIAVISISGELTVSELAESEGIAVSTASLLVSKLVDAGLVVRREDSEDRRRIWLSIHPDYRAEGEAILEQRLAPLRRVYERFTAQEMATVLEVLDALALEVSVIHQQEK